MARPFYKLYSPAAEDTDGIADDVTGAGAITLLSSSAGDGLAHQISFASSANLSGLTFTITGTDADGSAQTEAVTGPNNNTVESAKYFKTWTSITKSATLGANTMDIGWVDEIVTPSIPLNWRRSEISIEIDVTGTINYTAQQTFNEMASVPPWNWSDSTDTDLVSATTDQISTLGKPVTAFRLKTNSYSSTPTIGLRILQADF